MQNIYYQTQSTYSRFTCVIFLFTFFVSWASASSFAQTVTQSSVEEDIHQLKSQLDYQQNELKKLEDELEVRDKKIINLEKRIRKDEKAVKQQVIEQSADQGNRVASGSMNSSLNPVGAAPPVSDKAPEVALLSNEGGVLTPRGTYVIEPFVEYSRSSVNEFAVNGITIDAAFLIGDISANRVARDLITTGATIRAGLTDRLEVEGKFPIVWRQDELTNTVANVNSQTNSTTTSGLGLGDVELAAHYQLNDGHDDWPYFISNLRLKSDTGSSPYHVPYNASGVATKLPTGTGFWAIEPSMTAIYPTDPAVVFANMGYIHSFAENVDNSLAGSFVGLVSPGDTYSLSLGMGVALNERLSFTLGYEHDVVSNTRTVINAVPVDSEVLQIGSALTGISYKINENVHINFNVSTGVTRDAPDSVISLRVPVTFGRD